jgi:hypothetical protein
MSERYCVANHTPLFYGALGALAQDSASDPFKPLPIRILFLLHRRVIIYLTQYRFDIIFNGMKTDAPLSEPQTLIEFKSLARKIIHVPRDEYEAKERQYQDKKGQKH